MTKVDEEIITALVTELQRGMLTEDQLRQGIKDLTVRSKGKSRMFFICKPIILHLVHE